MSNNSDLLSIKLTEKLKMSKIYPLFDIGKSMNNVITEDKYIYFKNKILSGKNLYIGGNTQSVNGHWWIDDVTNKWYLDLKMDGSGGVLFCEKRLNKSFYQSLWALNITVVNSKQDVAALKRRYTIEDIVEHE